MKILHSKLADGTALSRLKDPEARGALLRQLRRPALEAFDIYKSNVTYGVQQETQEEKEAVLAWYRAVLDMEEGAILAPPPAVRAYMGGKA